MNSSRLHLRGRSILLFCGLAITAFEPKFGQERRFLTPDTVTAVVLKDQTVFLQPYFATLHHQAGEYAEESTLIVANSAEFKIDALHRLENPGQWLFSLGALANVDGLPSEIDCGKPGVSKDATQLDVIIAEDSETFRCFFCPSELTEFVEAARGTAGLNTDAVYLEQADGNTELVVSFEPSVRVDGVDYAQADLVRFRATGDGCWQWELVGKVFDSSQRCLDGDGDLTCQARDLTAAAMSDQGILMAFDEQVTLVPSSPGSTLELNRGEVALWDGADFSPAIELTGWPENNVNYINALTLPPETCEGVSNQRGGTERCLVTPPELTTCGGAPWIVGASQKNKLEWAPSPGTVSYNVYSGGLDEDTLKTLTSTKGAELTCETPGGTTSTQFELGDNAESRFYLVTNRPEQSCSSPPCPELGDALSIDSNGECTQMPRSPPIDPCNP